eukprot:CCRYP_001511-RA/>CCRYP_001511-RA protein AED:0.13 eAED:-0.11 QI:0/-1/0/1/-1/0/1/0/93
MYMELPKGIETRHGSLKDYIWILLSNLYGQKQAGCILKSYSVEKLRSIGFQPSLIDECIFLHDDVIFIVYVDDGTSWKHNIGSQNQSIANSAH